MEEFSVEEAIFELGNLYKSKKNSVRQMDICHDLERANILIEDDGSGNGWRLIDDGGMQDIPSRAKHLVWCNKAYAWAFWMGMGMPKERTIMCKANPMVLHASIGGGNPIELEDIEIVKSAPNLRVVE